MSAEPSRVPSLECSMDPQRDVREQLANCLRAADISGCFSADVFFANWMKQSGASYFFLFTKNLRVTNIQFAELFALIRAHSKCPATHRDIELQFVSLEEFRDALSGTIQALSVEGNAETKYSLVVDTYLELLSRLAVVESFYGSCAVHVPPTVTLNLCSICAYSGYVHSCGRAVYIRNVNEATKSTLFEALGAYLEQLPKDKKVFFTVFGHEDFSPFDRSEADELRDGLDDVKVSIDKFYLGSERLLSVLQELRKKHGDRLVIPDPGNYRKKHRLARKTKTLDTTRTIWLIVDRLAGDPPSIPGPERYYICYDQVYRNENPFHIFDENKPAWLDHTTMPHTLVGAMINITRPWWPRDTDGAAVARLCDPFVGTGTTWLESTKYPNVQAQGSDLCSVAATLSNDNLDFFSKSAEELKEVDNNLKALERLSRRLTRPKSLGIQADRVSEAYDWAVTFLDRLGESADDLTQMREVLRNEFSESKCLFERIVFYLVRRTNRRHIASLQRGSVEWEAAFRNEVRKLRLQLSRLINLREREQAGSRDGTVMVLQGRYSNACSISSEALRALHRAEATNKQVRGDRDATTDMNADGGAFDLLITDPPYGFNTDPNPAKMATLYSKFIAASIEALSHGGQLVLAVPDKSYTGRQLLSFTQKDFITHQVLVTASRVGCETIQSASSMPGPAHTFRAPYYWESARALRRAILHFRLRPRPEDNTDQMQNA